MTVIALPSIFALRARPAELRASVMADDAEFDRFFVGHYDGLVRSLTAITGDRERAADCVQEAFIKAFARWGRIRRFDSPVTWVRRVAINSSRDMVRSEGRRRRREDNDRLLAPSVQPSAADTVHAEVDLIELLQRLTPQQRAVAALFYLEDVSVAEIAQSLGLSTGAVKFHLNKARASLKALLEPGEAQRA